MAGELSRLEVFYYRLEAQHACLRWAFDRIAATPGPIFELGLGKGRTYDHLRRNLPGRDIYVFERDVRPIPGCMPPADSLVEGDIETTLPHYAAQFAGAVAMAHCDIGDYSPDHNRKISRVVTQTLPPAIAPGGYILSDLPLDPDGFEALPLPQGAMEGRYFVYRKPLAAREAET